MNISTPQILKHNEAREKNEVRAIKSLSQNFFEKKIKPVKKVFHATKKSHKMFVLNFWKKT